MDNEQLTIEVKENALKTKSYQFALKVVKLCQKLQVDKREYVLSKQLLRSGTAIGALTEEANQAESKADFIHKLSIANKEANESQYWLRLMMDADIITVEEGKVFLENCNELIRIVTASIKTTKSKL
jgi:four helix bundle protein